MEQAAAQFIVSGEVLGQRPMSQKRRDLDAIAYHSDLEDLLLRPLSAKLLPPTRPEREGWVDRDKLFAFSGRSRKGLIRLAHEFGLQDIPAPSTGCALTERAFSRKVRDLIQWEPDAGRWDFELLKVGRHFRCDAFTKIIVGRKEAENARLEYLHQLPEGARCTLLLPHDYPGAAALIVGPPSEVALVMACGLMHRYGKPGWSDQPLAVVRRGDRVWTLPVAASQSAQHANLLTVA
jgi:hypothetical protein